MFRRGPEEGLLDTLRREGVGGIAFSPLAQGLLSDRYLGGDIPADSRAARPQGFLRPRDVDEHRLGQARALNAMARARGQSLAQMALAWVLRDSAVTSALVGTSRVEQLEQNIAAVQKLDFTSEELAGIEKILAA
jgi:L-glyceraldehyde 3-phosphate reductase